ncbi:MAG: metal-dependent transcriptional regulator [Nitrospirae bacterium]|nr:metal-dependent transcriptional regulator [Nitrospirota bacterium]MBI5695521.1 metal-dependent transcriptional regulator [Nitrospirota bacterium]
MTHKKPVDLGITEEIVDEFLEALWLIEEKTGVACCDRARISSLVVGEDLVENEEKADSILDQLVKFGYITLAGGKVDFTPGGRERGKNIIRRKRLAEKLLAEVLSVGPSETRTSACRIEHVLSPEVTDSVCSFLGHPPTCPHGKPIPHGDCCKKLAHHMRPLVMPLTDLDPGKTARIVFIAPRDHGRMDRLSTLGIVPGTEILLHQKRPAFVIRSGETELALDIEIASEIYVKQIS